MVQNSATAEPRRPLLAVIPPAEAARLTGERGSADHPNPKQMLSHRQNSTDSLHFAILRVKSPCFVEILRCVTSESPNERQEEAAYAQLPSTSHRGGRGRHRDGPCGLLRHRHQRAIGSGTTSTAHGGQKEAGGTATMAWPALGPELHLPAASGHQLGRLQREPDRPHVAVPGLRRGRRAVGREPAGEPVQLARLQRRRQDGHDRAQVVEVVRRHADHQPGLQLRVQPAEGELAELERVRRPVPDRRRQRADAEQQHDRACT